jgi:hypothetical protein
MDSRRPFAFQTGGNQGAYGAVAMSPDPVTAVSDQNGLVQFPGTFAGSTYELRREGGTRRATFRVSGQPTFCIPNVNV